MSKTFRTIKRSAGTPSVSRAKLTAAARTVVARNSEAHSAAAGGGAPGRSGGSGVGAKAAPRGTAAAPAPGRSRTVTNTAPKAGALGSAASAAIHAPSVIRASEPAPSR